MKKLHFFVKTGFVCKNLPSSIFEGDNATSLLARFPDPLLEANGSGNLATSLHANTVVQKEPDGLKSQAGCLLLGRFISLLPSEDLRAICTWPEFRSPTFLWHLHSQRLDGKILTTNIKESRNDNNMRKQQR